ncbi:hypothetical protein ACFTWF_03115 [Rhodococcus sp. NPDC056960]|uniref:hypothetical protein n=1 Tax=Rhodococcus sp. NPDC056960 TaxID=3345982 RepID=UPI00363647CE
MSEVEWTPAMQTWLEETLSRSKPLTEDQLAVIKREFGRAAREEMRRQEQPERDDGDREAD